MSNTNSPESTRESLTDLIKKGYIGNTSQLASVRRLTVSEGKAKGTGIIEVKTAGGLELEILPDSGMDIGMARYRGVPVSWMCKNGYDSPAVFNPHESEFSNNFPGGLLYTCGLRNVGPSCRDGDEWHTVHGKYHSLAADQISAEIEGDNIVVRGVIRETALFGYNLEVRRTITLPVFGASVTISDTTTNLCNRDEEIMRIYHCNFGYPLLSEHAHLYFPEGRTTIPRTEFAKTGLGREGEFDKPVDNEPERVFFHLMDKDFCVRLENPAVGIRTDFSWSGDTLPILSQWRSMASGDYVLGLEPTNNYIMGRAAERANGTLQVLKAFDSIKTEVRIAFSAL